ncbi:hypothetical protein FB45DRAFT_1033010 [Roridomyces roridus]|uniref:Uncharacterized protein n=1 Tax=Roridomyces roridus TaxID=1738132 RepID=A0AAD7FHE7_9AGAR|nr:hypothetical protein FB45DRAFT_1033010 [Roridomyces roridus]
MDPVYIALILCLLATNLGRIHSVAIWLSNWFTTNFMGPTFVPYLTPDGEILGRVRIPPDRRRDILRRPTSAAAAETSSNEHPSQDDDRKTRRVPASKKVSKAPTPMPSLPASDSPHWDCWPDGEFRRLFKLRELELTQDLASNWVLETLRTRGSVKSPTWAKVGPGYRRVALPTRCTTDALHYRRQLQLNCPLCGETLFSRDCGVESSVHRFLEGVYFIHEGFHTHGRFTHSTRSSLSARQATIIEYSPRFIPSNELSLEVDAAEEVSSLHHHHGPDVLQARRKSSDDSSVSNPDSYGTADFSRIERKEMMDDPDADAPEEQVQTDGEIDELDESE